MNADAKSATLDLRLWKGRVDLPVNASLPWNHQEPLCAAPLSQVTPDRRGRSYRFSFDEVMRSLQAMCRSSSRRHRALVEAPVHHRLDAAAGQLEYRCHRQSHPDHHQAEVLADELAGP